MVGEVDEVGVVGVRVGWNVGLWDGAWRGFLGSREIGGEFKTSDWPL